MDSSLYALNKNKKNMTKLFVNKDIIGQTSGLLLALYTKNFGKSVMQKGISGIVFQQIAISSELLLYKYPSRYLLINSFSNVFRNISWISIGAANSSIIANIASESNKEISDIFTNVSVVNTIGSSIGMYIGTKIVQQSTKYSHYLSPILCMLQIGLFYQIATNLKSNN